MKAEALCPAPNSCLSVFVRGSPPYPPCSLSIISRLRTKARCKVSSPMKSSVHIPTSEDAGRGAGVRASISAQRTAKGGGRLMASLRANPRARRCQQPSPSRSATHQAARGTCSASLKIRSPMCGLSEAGVKSSTLRPRRSSSRKDSSMK